MLRNLLSIFLKLLIYNTEDVYQAYELLTVHVNTQSNHPDFFTHHLTTQTFSHTI